MIGTEMCAALIGRYSCGAACVVDLTRAFDFD